MRISIGALYFKHLTSDLSAKENTLVLHAFENVIKSSLFTSPITGNGPMHISGTQNLSNNYIAIKSFNETSYESVNIIRFGRLLPNKEKKYWIFIDADMIKKAVHGASHLFVTLYFSYTYVGGMSTYGTISQFDEKNDTFIHTAMWLD